MSHPLDKQFALNYGEALSTPLESILYGVSVYMFGVTFRYLLRRRGPSGKTSCVMLIMACWLFTLSTMGMAISIYRFVYIFALHREESANIYLTSTWSFIMEGTIMFIEIILGDAIVLYRCHVVWSSVLVIILPAMLWVITLVTGIMTIWTWARVKADPSLLLSKSLDRLTGICLGGTLAGNAISTGLLAYRLWNVERETLKHRQTNCVLRRFARVAAQSGALYSFGLTLYIILYYTGSYAYFIAKGLLTPIIAICFYVVLLCCAHHRDADTDNVTNQPLEFRTVQNDAEHRAVEICLTQEVVVMDDHLQISRKM